MKYWLLAFLFFIIGMASCHRGENEAPNLKTLKINFYQEPLTIDPRLSTYSIYTNIFPMLYDSLMRFTPQRDVEPSVAKSFKMSRDGKKFTFYLRDSVWSDGSTVTSYDFEASWKWMLSPDNPSPLAHHFYVIHNAKAAKEGKLPLDSVGIKTPDDKTLVIELEHPAPYFVELVTFYSFFPTKEGKRLFNGPFVLKEWVHGQYMVLEKNPFYWDRDAVKLDRIHITFVSDINTELQLFESGAIDWAGAPTSPALPNDAIAEFKKERKLQTVPALATYYYVFNTQKFPLNNKNIRRALSCAIPRPDIVEHITQGEELPAYRFVPTPKAQNRFVMEAAHAFFEEGLRELNLTKSTFPKISISYNSTENHHKIAQTIANVWEKEFGITIELNNKDWKTHLNDLKNGNYDVGRLAWKGMHHDPENFLELFTDPDNCMNCSGWENKRYNSLLAYGKNSHDIYLRNKHFKKAEDLLISDMPIAPIYYPTISYIKNPKLKREYVSELGSVDFKWAYLND